MVITQEEFDLLLEKCRELPLVEDGKYVVDDYVENLFLTVLDFMMHRHAVENAIGYYKQNRWSEFRTHRELTRLLSKHSDDKEGNTIIAQYLWGNRHWTRVSLLRKLIIYFETAEPNAVTSQEGLSSWAYAAKFREHFSGKISGMGFAIFQWLVMRQGVDTVKPDVRVRKFVESAIHSRLTDEDVVELVERAAKQLGLKANQLDATIWDAAG